jgi:CHAT domain-containing protein
VSKAEALRQAQLALLADTERGYGHPYYWSPYLMISNWL